MRPLSEMPTVLAAPAFLLVITCLVASIAHADGYRLMPLPVLGTTKQDQLIQPLPGPENLAVCQTYLQNLNYAAQRNVPMSCKRPIAPEMRSRIQDVEWEDLDPQRYFRLFNALTKELFGKVPVYIPDDLSQELRIKKTFSWVHEPPTELTGPNEYALDELRKRLLVFRRAKLGLRGYPTHPSDLGIPKTEAESIHIVQFGHDVMDSDYPGTLRCNPMRGPSWSDFYSAIRLYVVSADLDDLYGVLAMLGTGTTGEHLFFIDGHPYVEHMHETGYINLFQINLNAPVFLEPICLYEFVKTN